MRSCARELDIPILSPEIAAGSLYTRADWILRDASDMSRIDVLRGGITGVQEDGLGLRGVRRAVRDPHERALATCRSWARPARIPASTMSAAWWRRAMDYDTPPPYLEELCDPMDDEGYVHVPQEPGMGYKINWDYIEEHRIAA